ncbi:MULTISPECIES: limonene-1,2-epoxide hydrolase family protein [Nocardioides]|uniref:Limonene-1,2-epoxide hydrolase family protein n=1 Tax=Nocardioides vastitatis TaxID=2568655 RepID=A0ABW0ZAM0_9ACTN|nr:limonene-1,2-epoxide hydrolase family protein [Nocardioides sp.]THJ08586.1 limonene-1,2-epoxide hydrolase [Nocardioides sp.]
MTEIDVVEAFLSRLEALDVEGALNLCSEDVYYQNVPLPGARGKEAVGKQLGTLARFGGGLRVETRNIAANGPIVLTERVDTLTRGSFAMDFWVCGTFEVRDGKIVLWRDYFDWANFVTAGAKGAGRAVVGAVSRRLGR